MGNRSRHIVYAAALISAVAVPASAFEGPAQAEYSAKLAGAKAAMMGNTAEALQLAQDAGKLASADTTEARKARLTAQWLEAEALMRLNRASEAQAIIASAIEEAERHFPDDKLNADLLRSHASLKANAGAYGDALSTFLQAHDRYQELGEARSRAIVLQNIGSLYSDARDYERVLRYYRQATEAYPEDLALSLSAHNNVGNALKELGRLDEAEAEFRRALEVAKQMNSPLLEARILTNIASTQQLNGQLAQANATIAEGLSLARSGAPEWLPFLYGVRSQINLADGRIAKARFDIARTFDGQNLEATSPYFRDFHEAAYEIYRRSDDTAAALPHLAAFYRLDGQARELSATANSALLAARFDAENRELRISKLSAEKEAGEAKLLGERNKVWLLSTLVTLIVAAFFAVLFTLRAVSRSRQNIAIANDKLTYLTQHDGLTGLHSRDHFHKLLSDEIASAQRADELGVLMLIDLDRFKQVNDSYGHPAGDFVLREVASRFRDAAGDTAVIGRLGGDEFAIFLPHAFAIEDAWEIAQDIIDSCAAPFVFDDNEVSIGASIGIARLGLRGQCTSSAMTNADLALYEAKDRGRGNFVNYNAVMRAQLEERSSFENDLAGALENGEISVNYQPIVDARTGRIQAYEALMRWQHPERGAVAPAQFIAVAEDTQLIEPLGAWLLRTACTDALNWTDDVKLTVNVSAIQLASRNFLSMVVDALARSGLSPERLVLELTETIVLEMDEGIERLIRSLDELGVSFALDDFGRGYSSLNYIEKLHFSLIKIDRDFVQAAAAGSRKSRAVVSAVVSLAKSLNIHVVAEGIECAQQAEAMEELGCTSFQGFRYGEPAPIGKSTTSGGAVASSNARAA